MIEAEFGLELLILLLDRPPLMRERTNASARRWRAIHKEVLRAVSRRDLFAGEPDLGASRCSR